MQRLLVNVLLSVVTICLVFGVLEGLARVYIWSRANLPLFHDREPIGLIEHANIADDAFNIYYFGGSTMKGAPYAPQMTIPKIVDYMHGHTIKGRPIRSINIATSGKDLQYNLRQIRTIASRKHTYHPSLFVIYSGHNEFLRFHEAFGFRTSFEFVEWLSRRSLLIKKVAERLQIYKVEVYERQLFDEPLFDQKHYDNVIMAYRQHLEEIVTLLRDKDIPFIISTVAGNYSDWQPNRSICHLAQDGKDKFEHLMERGRGAEERLRYTEAIMFYQQALQLCERFAETHYRLGKVYEAMKKYEEALEQYHKAVDYDGMPIRAVSVQNDFIRRLDEDNLVGTADAVKALQEQTSNGLVGFNLMIDGHHPNQRGYVIIGGLIARKIKDMFGLNGKQLNNIGRDEAGELFHIDQEKRLDMYISTGRWLVRLSTWRYDPVERLKRAEEYFREAMKLDQGRYEPYLGLAMVSVLRNMTHEARRYLSKAESIDAQKVDRYLSQYWIRSIMRHAEVSR